MVEGGGGGKIPKLGLKKSFSKSFFASFLNLVFISTYGFNHAFSLNWITMCTLTN